MNTCGKKIEQLTWGDILSINYNTVDNFKRFLINKGDGGNYINQKLYSCKALWKKLHYINRDVDMETFEFEEEEYEKKTYATLNETEMNLLFDYVSTKEYKPLTRRLFFEFLYNVGCRKEVANTIQWKNIIKQRDNKYNIDVYVLKYKDKGKWIEKAIHDDFYNKLIQLKNTESKGKFIFDISIETLENDFDEFKRKYDIGSKNGKQVCIHSIKKGAGQKVQNAFGDINLTSKFLQHKNVNMTADIYLGDENYCEQASYMISKNINVDMFAELDKDTLIKIISNSGTDVMFRLYTEYEKLKKSSN
jgi:integrase